MDIRQFIKNNIVILDGGLGTLLQSRGLKPGEEAYEWNTTHQADVIFCHRMYFDAGSNVVCTNTFSANLLKMPADALEKNIAAAIANVKKAINFSVGNQEKFVAFDMGSLGKMLKPYGDMDFEEAVRLFSYNARIAEQHGADLIFIETMNDIGEARAALIAAKEATNLPVFVSCAYGEDGKLLTGTSPRQAVAIFEGLGADALGVNCSFGPDKLMPVIEEYLSYSNVPVIFKPNAGMPKSVGGKTVYDISPAVFTSYIKEAANKGVSIIGGCCGTTPEYIKTCVTGLKNTAFTHREENKLSSICSSVKSVELGKKPVIVGERINPTGRKLFREAIGERNWSVILTEGVNQQEHGADILDVNLGAPGTDEADSFSQVIPLLQSVCDIPLQIDTSDSIALEKALRIYNGKALINSVNGKEDSMNAVFPLIKKYGGTVVALTLDEKGIPKTAEGRIAIAKKILSKANEYGISKEEIVFDALVMAVSAQPDAANITLETVRRIKEELGCKTILGISNVSFGLPDRDTLNSSFFTCCLAKGLDAGIVNPFSEKIMSAYRSFTALSGYDTGFEEYIKLAGPGKSAEVIQQEETDLKNAVIKGLKDKAQQITECLIKDTPTESIIENYLIPALDEVGKAYEKGSIFLPGLLMSAEAAKGSFEIIKAENKTETEKTCGTVVIATVEGDIHDIGKNIVKLLLENYGFKVFDLGMNVSPDTIVQKTVKEKAQVVGLSALMTTTLPAMETTVKLIKQLSPKTKIVVGGAVLTEEYAKGINADFYAKDATQTVEIAKSVCQSLKY